MLVPTLGWTVISAVRSALLGAPRKRTPTVPAFLAASLSCAALVLALGPGTGNAAAACPNLSFRTGFSSTLPDCRAYELVSPPSVQPHFETFGAPKANVKFGVALVGAELGATASQSGAESGLAFFSTFAPPGSATDGPYYLSTRGQAGWTTHNVIPPQSTEVSALCLPYMIAWSPSLGRGILVDGLNGFRVTCGADEPELVQGEPRGNQNVFVRDNSTGTYELVDQMPLTGAPAAAFFQAASSDLAVVVFDEAAKLTSEAPATGRDYYVWTAGSGDRLLTILPDGQPTEGAIADAALEPGRIEEEVNPTSPTFSHAVAPDGSRVEFTAGGNLYARENPAAPQSALNGAKECVEAANACTVEIDSSETSEPSGGGVFEGTSGTGGDLVFFLDANRLTSDSTATAGEPDLYEYDFRKPSGERLTDLTAGQNVGEHGDALGYVGSSETGTPGDYVYFVAGGVLASNENSAGEQASPGVPNLYMTHEGMTSFVATLSLATDSCDWENRCMTARVSRSGRYVGFDSLESLTGFDNRDAETTEPDQEIFLYDGEANSLSCASCGTLAQRPTAPASIKLPAGVATLASTPLNLQRNVSDSGQVFFDTQNALVGAAQNGLSNVYEYQNEQLHLLSSGTAESPSYFYDASADGGDVYLITSQGLVQGADPAEMTLYDVKVDGGFPAPPLSTEPCSGEACSGPQAPAVQSPPNGSETFVGPGNMIGAASNKRATVKVTKASLADGRRKLVLRIAVSGSGQILASLKGGRSTKRAAAKAGTYALQIGTTARERTALARGKRLTISVTYRAGSGSTARSVKTIRAAR